jgi:hypothetical protein
MKLTDCSSISSKKPRTIMPDKKQSLVPSHKKTEAIDVIKVNHKTRESLADFRKQLQAKNPRRIIFASDATGSRAPFWESAKVIQARMLEDAMQYGNAEMKIVAYRDRFADPNDFIEESEWSSDSNYLRRWMTNISCHGGGGNDGESIDAALRVALEQEPTITAVILVGDEPILSTSRDTAYKYASELGKKGIPVFAFQEGDLPGADNDFRAIAENSGGIYDHFTGDSKVDFGDRLRVVSVFATGGKDALDNFLKKHKSTTERLSEGAKNLAKRLLKPKGD